MFNRFGSPMRVRVYQRVMLALIAGLIGGVGTTSEAAAKTPGKTYCFNGICHRVKTISETQKLVGMRTVMHASHYDSCKNDRYNPCGLTSSGEEFRPWKADNAASPLYPDGTQLLVWHPGTKKAAVVRINNAGPYYGKRTLDLSRATAEKLGFSKAGVSTVHAKVLSAPTQAEATYKRNRTYAAVPGYIGFFETIDTALMSVGRAFGSLFTSPAHAASGRPERPEAPAAAAQPQIKLAAKTSPPKSAAAPARKPATTVNGNGNGTSANGNGNGNGNGAKKPARA